MIENNTAAKLERVPVNENLFNEAWLQKLIHDHPHLLPIQEIETGFSPLISIGREVSTPAGFIDNLFISPDGYITIIETKLWRNAEARREVVGQIIDYAKELSRWTYTDLDKRVKEFNKTYNSSTDNLFATMCKSRELEDSDEQLFTDNVSRNLARGRFLLLIVGDGIRESVEDMAAYLSQNPQLYFTLALVELQVYRVNREDNSFVVIPQLVTRTKEITRAIVRIEGPAIPGLQVNIETELDDRSGDQQSRAAARLTITAQDFFEQLEKNTSKDIVAFTNHLIQDCQEMGLVMEWNVSSLGVKLPEPKGSGTRISIFTIDKYGFIYLGYSKGQFQKLNIPIALSYRFAADTAALIPGVQQHPENKYVWDKYALVINIQSVYPQFLVMVKEYIDNIQKAMESKGVGES